MTKTILITGASDGIGLLTAQDLSQSGHTLLLHGRSEEKLARAAEEIGGEVETFCADLSSLEETRAMVEAVRARTPRLDVLINNAGVLKTPTPVLADGQDIRFVVNTLAPYILAKGLLPLMPPEGRVLNLSSAAQAPVNAAAMRGGVPMDDMMAYSQSKRAITLWSAALAKAHPAGPLFIAVNPGSLLGSKMVREGFGIEGNDLQIGADILCQLALDPAHAGDSGKYWDNDAGRFATLDLSQAEEVLQLVEELT